MTYRKSFFTGLLYLFAAFGMVQLMGLLLRMALPYMPTKSSGPSTQAWGITFTPLQFFGLLLVVFGFAATWEYFRMRRKNRSAR